MPPAIGATTHHIFVWLAQARTQQRSSALLEGLCIALAVGAFATILSASWWTVIVGGAASGFLAVCIREWQRYKTARTPLQLARHLDQTAGLRDVFQTALSVESGTATGAADFQAVACADALTHLQDAALYAVPPFRYPKAAVTSALVAIGIAVAWPNSPAHPESARIAYPAPSPAGLPATESASPADAQTPAALSSADARSEAGAGSGGGDRRSAGGADEATRAGVQAKAGTGVGSGDAAATAEGEATAMAGQSGGGVQSGSGQVDDRFQTESLAASRSQGPSPDIARPTASPDQPDEDRAGMAMESPVAGTAAVQSNERSTATMLAVPEGTTPDIDAQTRETVGLISLDKDAPAFFSETEEAKTEQDEDGGAGGWTVGLSQPGRGGVNDAAGSTFQTDQSPVTPPEGEVPADWIEAAWRDSPAGVLRRVHGGQAGGNGSLPYAEVWTRYAAVAEASTSLPSLPDGRRELVRRYFLSIAPKDAP